MLKFLRKYNTWIMVIAGSLLMVTFLLQQSLSELGKQQAMRSTLRVNGSKVPGAELDLAYREYNLVQTLLGRGIVEQALGIQGGKHWYLLTREASAAGLVGGPKTGRDYLPALAQDLVSQALFMQPQAEQDRQIAALTAEWTNRLDSVGAQSRLTPDEAATAIAKAKGTQTLRGLYRRTPRFSDRRLATSFRSFEDTSSIDFVFIPPDREVPNIPRPTDDAIGAFFEKYKDVAPGDESSGEFKVGYKQTERVRLNWLVINRKAIESVILPDALEVQKRFIRMYPDGKPATGTPEGAKELLAAELKDEMTEKVLKAADLAIKSEIDKAVRIYPQDGRYWTLPADWAAKSPTIEKLAEAASRQMNEVAGDVVDPPKVVKRDDEWKTLSKLASLDGIGRSQMRRGDRSEPFTQVALKAREIAGSNDYAIQVGIPPEPTFDAAGNVYYYILTDARKSSAPDSLDEVRPDVVKDLMQIEAFKRLAARSEEFRAIATSAGLEPLTKPDAPKSSGVVDSTTLTINKGTVKLDRVSGSGINVNDVNHEAFRKAVVDAAAKLDPTKKIDEIPAADRTVVMAIPQSRGVAVAIITSLNPVTIERFRAMQDNAVGGVLRKQFVVDEKNDPYTLANMEKRLNVEDTSPKDDAEEEKPLAAAGK